MSMLSAQCVKLREMASQLQEHGTFVGFGGTTSTDPLMLKSATLLREAADTIWELRDDLQRANAAVRDAEHDESRAWDRVRKAEAEADRLREELESVGTAAYLYGRSDLKAENAKLRKLAQDLLLNLRNRETILELAGLPPTAAQKAAMTALSNTCNELGVEVP